MSVKVSSSQAAYALLSEGVSSARVEAHRLRHMINRALKVIEESKAKDHLYQMAGDLILGVPNRMDALETVLDKTSYALTIMGKDFLEARLPIDDKQEVDDAVKYGQSPLPGGGGHRGSVSRIAAEWLEKSKK